MKRWIFLFIVFTALSLSIHIARAQAANPAPLPVTPQNGQIVPSVHLEWLVPDYILKNTSPYRVQIANNPNFQPIEKDYYTQNTYYAPTSLEEGVYYWRILARDINSIESDWSQTVQFNYSTFIPPSPTASPSISPTPNPSPSVIPSPSISPSPTAQSSPTPTPSPYFTLSNLPTTINSTESFQLVVSLFLPQSSQTVFYLKGAFYEEGSSNYFGQTKYAENWIKNSQTYSSQYKIQTDSQGKWQGKIEFIPDPQDSGFTSSGEYHFKIGRYTTSGSGPTWSDHQTIYISEVVTPSPSPSSFPSPSVSPAPNPTTSPIAAKNTSELPAQPQLAVEESTTSAVEATASTLLTKPEIPTIAGVATVAGDLATKKITSSSSKINPGWFYLGSGLLFLAGIGSAFIVKYKPDWSIEKWLLTPTQPKIPKNSPPLWQRDLPPEEEWWRSSGI